MWDIQQPCATFKHIVYCIKLMLTNTVEDKGFNNDSLCFDFISSLVITNVDPSALI